MELTYAFNKNCCIANVSLDGLDGCEQVASVKEALNMMKIKNPAITFADHAKAGMYNDVSDEDYQRMLNTVKCVSSLWQYRDAPEDTRPKSEMNALMLLVNAVELISRLNAQSG